MKFLLAELERQIEMRERESERGSEGRAKRGLQKADSLVYVELSLMNALGICTGQPNCANCHSPVARFGPVWLVAVFGQLPFWPATCGICRRRPFAFQAIIGNKKFD